MNHISSRFVKKKSKTKCTGTDDLFFTVQTKKIIIKRIYYIPILLCIIWVFHHRKLNNWINHIHERTIRLVYKDYTSSFDELLFKDNSLRIHHRSLQKLAIQIFKVKLGIAPDIMKNVSPIIENPYNLRNETKFKSRNVKTVRYGIETASFVAPRIWSSIPRNCKECSSVNEFKAKIKFWYPENCPCKLCKNYIYQIGYT